MSDRAIVLRLSGGEPLVGADVVPLLRDLIEVALNTRRDLWTARDVQAQERVRVLRALVEATFEGSAQGSEVGTVEPLPSQDPASWEAMSTQEAANVLDVTPRRVLALLDAGRISGAQDGPGRPWRVDAASVRDYRDDRGADAHAA